MYHSIFLEDAQANCHQGLMPWRGNLHPAIFRGGLFLPRGTLNLAYHTPSKARISYQQLYWLYMVSTVTNVTTFGSVNLVHFPDFYEGATG
jgi:hypothetical protein